MAINQETAARVRQYIYHHPADTPLQGLTIREDSPAPGIQEPDLDHFIRPHGIFNNTANDHKRRPPLDDGDSDGFSLSDIPWPIPGRRPPTKG